MANGNLALKLTIQADGTALVQATQQGVRGLKEVGDQAGRTSVQIRGVGEANSKVTASFSDIGKGAVVFTAVASLASRAASAIAELPRAGIGFAAEIETAQLGIAGVLTSMTEVNGQATQFVQSQGIARTITRQLADDAARTAASTTELVGAFQALVGPGLAAGMTVQQIRELAVTGVSAVKALGLEQRQVVQELRDLVQGGITPASSTLATALGLKDADIAKARSSADGLFNFLTERLQGFEQASDAFAATFSGRLQALQEQATRSSAAALAPVIAEIGNQATALTQALKDDSGVRTLEGLASAAALGVKAVGELVRLGLEYSGVLGTLATAYVGLKLGGVVASLAEKARVTGQASEASRLAAVTAAAEGQASAAVAQTTRQEIAAKIAGLQATVTATQGERALAQAKVASLQGHAASIAQARVAAQVQLQEANTTQRAALAIGAHSAALAAARQAAAQRSAALRELATLGTAQVAVERQLTAAQVASQAAANNATTAVQRLTAAKGAAGVAAGAAAAAGRGFSAVIGALGGPVGIAITAVTLLIGKLVQMRAEAARAAGANLSEERVRTALDNNQPVDDFDLGGLNTGINELKQRRDALELDFRKLRDQGLAATDAVALATVTAAGGIDTTASFAADQLQGHIDQLAQIDAEIKSKSELTKRAADAANEATSGIGLNAAQSGKALAGLLEDVKTATGLREKAKQQTDAITAATTREVAAMRQRNASSSEIAKVEARSAEAVKAIQVKLNSELKSLNEQGASDAKAIAEGRFAVTKAVAEQVAEIERNTLALFSKANEAAYAKGTLDATAYYTERARLLTADLDLQEKALTAELVAAQVAADSASKTEDKARAQARVVEITTKLIELGRERLQVDGPEEIATREWEAYAAAAEKRYQVAADGADALTTELRNLEQEGTLIGQTEEAVRALLLARAEQAAQELERQALVARGIDLDGVAAQKLQEQADMTRRIAQQRNNNAVAQQTADVAERIESTFRGSFLRLTEAGKSKWKAFTQGLYATFKTEVADQIYKTFLKPFVVKVIGNFLGIEGGVANAAVNAVSGGSITGLAQNASTLNTLYGVGSQFLTGSAVGASAASLGFANIVGAVGGDALGALIAANGGYAGVAVGSAAGAGAAAGGAAAGGAAGGGSLYASAAAAGPYVVAALAVLNALGVFRSKKIVDGGLQGELGGQVNDYALQRKGGTLFSGPSYRVLDQGISAQNQALQDSYNAIRNSVAGMAEQLGVGNDAIKAFTVRLGNDLIHPDTGGFGIKTQGLTQEEIIAKIEAALVSANEQLAAFALGTTQYTRNGETAVQTLGRLTGSLQTLNGSFDLLGFKVLDASLANADAASQFLDSFGGIEGYLQASSSFYQNYFSETERTAQLTEQLTEQFAALGFTLPTSRNGLRDLVQQQASLGAGALPTVAKLLQLEGAFASITPPAEALFKTIAEATDLFVQAQERVAAASSDVTASLQALQDFGQGLRENVADAQANINQLRGQAIAAVDAATQESLAALQALRSYSDSVASALAENQASINQLRGQARQDVLQAESALQGALANLRSRSEQDAQAVQAATDNVAQARDRLSGSVQAIADALANAASGVTSAAQEVAAAQAQITQQYQNAVQARDAVRGEIANALSQASQAYEAAQQRVIDLQRQAGQAALGFADDLDTFLRSLQTGDLGSGSALARPAAASQQFELLASRAAAGDQAARSALTGAATTLLQSVRQYGTGAQQLQDTDFRVRQVLYQLGADARAQGSGVAGAPQAEDPNQQANQALADALTRLEAIQAVASAAGVTATAATRDLLADYTAAEAVLSSAAADVLASGAQFAVEQVNLLTSYQTAQDKLGALQAQYDAMLGRANASGFDLKVSAAADSLGSAIAAAVQAEAELQLANQEVVTTQAASAASAAAYATALETARGINLALADDQTSLAALVQLVATSTNDLAAARAVAIAVEADKFTADQGLLAQYTGLTATAQQLVAEQQAIATGAAALGVNVDEIAVTVDTANSLLARLGVSQLNLAAANEVALQLQAERFEQEASLVDQYQLQQQRLAGFTAELEAFEDRVAGIDFSGLAVLDPLGDLLSQYAGAVAELLDAQQGQATANAELGEALARQYFAQIKNVDQAAYIATGQGLDVAGGATASQVDAVYQSLLGRNIESQQLASAIAGYIDAGQQTFAGLSADIRASAEFLARSYGVDVQGSFNSEVGRLLGNVPGFASGGDFGGGLRIVGERGMELEATGPARIFNADQTRQILSGGGGDNSELLAVLRELLREVRALGATSPESRALLLQISSIESILKRSIAPGTNYLAVATPRDRPLEVKVTGQPVEVNVVETV